MESPYDALPIQHHWRQELKEQRRAMGMARDGGTGNGGVPIVTQPPIGVMTHASTTTPDHVLKKSRVEQACPVEPRRLYDTQDFMESQECFPERELPDTKPATPHEAAAEHLGETGESPDEIQTLKSLNEKLIAEKAALEKEVCKLTQQLKSLSIESGDCNSQGDGSTQIPASDDAARKRLGRICGRNSQGKHGYIRGSSKFLHQEILSPNPYIYSKVNVFQWITHETISLGASTLKADINHVLMKFSYCF